VCRSETTVRPKVRESGEAHPRQRDRPRAGGARARKAPLAKQAVGGAAAGHGAPRILCPQIAVLA